MMIGLLDVSPPPTLLVGLPCGGPYPGTVYVGTFTELTRSSRWSICGSSQRAGRRTPPPRLVCVGGVRVGGSPQRELYPAPLTYGASAGG